MAKGTEKAIIEKIKHIETFYEKPPPGTVQEYEEKPEDCIPDTEANRKAREFLASAPTKGLWMPLGKEVKVMQCWKCKNYGHRTGDKECPLFTKGNAAIEKFREMYEDPMYSVLNSETRKKQDNKLKWLQQILNESSTDTSSQEEKKKSKKSHKKKKQKKKHKEKWVEKKLDDDDSNNDKKKTKKLKKSKDSKKNKCISDRHTTKKRYSSDDSNEIPKKKHKKHEK